MIGLTKWNVDVAQWRALVRTGLRHDLRHSRFLSATGRRSVNPATALIFVGLFSLLLGVGFASFAVGARSLALASFLSCSSVMFIAASLILVEYYAIIVSPDDFHALGHLPMTSQTYFMAKLTNLLIYILGFSSLTALPAAIGFMLRPPFSPARLGVAFLCMCMGAFTAAMSMALFYTALTRLLPQRSLKYIVSIVQVLASFLIYGGYALLPRLVPENWMELAWQPKSRHLLIPSAWFAGLMQVMLGDLNAWAMSAAIIGIVVCVGSAYYGIHRLARSYFAIIAGQAEIPASRDVVIENGAPSRQRFRLAGLFRQSESRIVATLLSSQFRNDTKFRMAILTIIPLIAIYMFLAVQDNSMHDPFVDNDITLAGNGLVYFAVLLIPIMVKQSIDVSDSFEAAWIFFASPTAAHRLVLAAKRVSYLYFVMPAVLLVSALFAYFFNNAIHAALHGVTLAALAYLLQQFIFLLRPTAPFSEPRTRGRQGAWVGLAFIVGPILGLLMLMLIAKLIYASPQRLAIFYVAMPIVCIVSDRILRWRVQRKFS
jgi:hypothetical protein